MTLHPTNPAWSLLAFHRVLYICVQRCNFASTSFDISHCMLNLDPSGAANSTQRPMTMHLHPHFHCCLGLYCLKCTLMQQLWWAVVGFHMCPFVHTHCCSNASRASLSLAASSASSSSSAACCFSWSSIAAENSANAASLSFLPGLKEQHQRRQQEGAAAAAAAAARVTHSTSLL